MSIQSEYTSRTVNVFLDYLQGACKIDVVLSHLAGMPNAINNESLFAKVNMALFNAGPAPSTVILFPQVGDFVAEHIDLLLSGDLEAVNTLKESENLMREAAIVDRRKILLLRIVSSLETPADFCQYRDMTGYERSFVLQEIVSETEEFESRERQWRIRYALANPGVPSACLWADGLHDVWSGGDAASLDALFASEAKFPVLPVYRYILGNLDEYGGDAQLRDKLVALYHRHRAGELAVACEEAFDDDLSPAMWALGG